MNPALVIFLVSMWLITGLLSWAFYNAMWERAGLKPWNEGVRQALLELAFSLIMGPLVIPFVWRRLP
jgi:hypothetical protein